MTRTLRPKAVQRAWLHKASLLAGGHDGTHWLCPIRTLFAGACLCAVLSGHPSLVAHSSMVAQQDASGRWEGVFGRESLDEKDYQQPLGIVVDLNRKQGGWEGSAVVAAWGERQWPLYDVQVDGDSISFRFEKTRAGVGQFRGRFVGQAIRGTYKWGGRIFPFELGREPLPAATQPSHPQVPKPPFPYVEEDVTFLNGPIALTATLRKPSGPGPHPAIVLLTGSGVDARDPLVPGPPGGARLSHWVLADSLTRAGVATLLMDDRGVGGSGGKYDDAEMSDLRDDALTATRFLRSREGIAADRIGLVGTSEGGVVAVSAAARSADIAFLVLLVSPSVPGPEVCLEGSVLLDRAVSTGAEAALWRNDPDRARQAVRTGLSYQARELLYALVRSDLPSDAVRREYVNWLTHMDPDGYWFSKAVIEQQLARDLTPHTRSYMQYDPRPDLARLSIPILAVYGDGDYRVSADQNYPVMKDALRKSGNRDATVVRVPGLKHTLRLADPKDLLFDKDSTETINRDVLKLITQWIAKRFVR